MRNGHEVVLELGGRRLARVKDRSKRSKPGKFSARAKADKPQSRFFAKLESECKKEAIRDIEECKRIISQARFSRKLAEFEGRQTRRQEVRYYLCYKHSVPQYHLTKLGEAEYAKRFDSFPAKEFSRAS